MESGYTALHGNNLTFQHEISGETSPVRVSQSTLCFFLKNKVERPIMHHVEHQEKDTY